MMVVCNKAKSDDVYKDFEFGIRKYLTIGNGVINVYEEQY
jgi:hypothetical protein